MVANNGTGQIFELVGNIVLDGLVCEAAGALKVSRAKQVEALNYPVDLTNSGTSVRASYLGEHEVIIDRTFARPAAP